MRFKNYSKCIIAILAIGSLFSHHLHAHTLEKLYSANISCMNTIEVQKLKIYPNPSTSGIFNLSSVVKYEVYSIIGENILQGEGSQIDLSCFSKGIYHIKTPNGIYKVIKK